MARWNYESCCWLDNDGTPLADYEPTAQDYARLADTLLDMPREDVPAVLKSLPDKDLAGLDAAVPDAAVPKPEASQ